MSHDLVKFYSVQREIFGLCHCCGEIFRLSDAKVYMKKKPTLDWMDKLEASEERLDRVESKIAEEQAAMRERAREKGRRQALRSARRVDPVFHPIRLNPDDAKLMLHPVDFLVFNGMKQGDIRNLVLLDRQVKSKEDKSLQRSIERTVDRQNYEFVTMQISEEGDVEYK